MKKPRRGWRSHAGRVSSFHTLKMAHELHDLLGIPKTSKKSSGGFWYERPDKGREIIQAIIKVLVDALHREETIQVRGFGTFKVEEVKNRKVTGAFLESTSDGQPLARADGPTPLPNIKKVVFIPSPHLMALLNQDEPYVPNALQIRTMRTWK